MRYRSEIDGLRAIAVLIVVIFHAFPKVLPGGFIGVDIFFVISGYLITSILLTELDTNSFSLWSFYQRRFRRIFPALIIVLCVAGALGWHYLLPNEFGALVKHIAGGAGFAANLVLWQESGYFDTAINQKPLMHLWSLGVEEQYYLVWPLILLLVYRFLPNYFTQLGWALLITSFAYSEWLVFNDPTAAFYSPLSRFWELLVGGLLAKWQLTNQRELSNSLNVALAGLGLTLIAVGLVLINESSMFPGAFALLPTIGAACIVLANSENFISRYVLSAKSLVNIGLISYPLYLWHWLFLSLARIQNPNPSWRLRVWLVILSVLLGAFTYHFVEKTIRHARSRWTTLLLITAMSCLLLLSLAQLKWNLLSHVWTPLQQQLSQHYDNHPPYRYKTCFLDPVTQGPESFSHECTEDSDATTAASRVLLWGDSLAAQLYPGMKVLQSEMHYQLTQRTAGSCPPGLAEDVTLHGHCDAINSSTRKWIIENHPDIVVLSGRWTNSSRSLTTRISTVIDFLKANGVKKIILVGPNPDWIPTLQQLLLRSKLQSLPWRMSTPENAWRERLQLEQTMEAVAVNQSISYLSVIKALCEGNQCLIRVSDQIPEGLISSDHDHFTAQASVYLFAQPNVKKLLMR